MEQPESRRRTALHMIGFQRAFFRRQCDGPRDIVRFLRSRKDTCLPYSRKLVKTNVGKIEDFKAKGCMSAKMPSSISSGWVFNRRGHGSPQTRTEGGTELTDGGSHPQLRRHSTKRRNSTKPTPPAASPIRPLSNHFLKLIRSKFHYQDRPKRTSGRNGWQLAKHRPHSDPEMDLDLRGAARAAPRRDGCSAVRLHLPSRAKWLPVYTGYSFLTSPRVHGYLI